MVRRYPAISSIARLLNLLCKEAGVSAEGKVLERTERLGKKFGSKSEAYKWLDKIWVERNNKKIPVSVPKVKKVRAVRKNKTPTMAERVWGEKFPSFEKMNGATKTWKELAKEFYASDAWRTVRFQALKASDGSCCLCGRSRRTDGVVLHVDHIKPRSKFPALELTLSNLQVLCEDCNLGKGNRDDTDWRPIASDTQNVIPFKGPSQ